MDFIVWIFAIIILYTNVNFLKNSVFHIARSLHSSFYVTFHQELFTQITICLIVCCCSVAKLCTTLRCQTLVRQAHLSMRFSRQEYWSGLPFPSPFFKFRTNLRYEMLLLLLSHFSCVWLCATPGPLNYLRTSLVAQMVKRLPIMRETGFDTWVRKIS